MSSTRWCENKRICVLCGKPDLALLRRRSRKNLNHTPIEQLHHLILLCVTEMPSKTGREYALVVRGAADPDSDAPHLCLRRCWVTSVKVHAKCVQRFVKVKDFTLIIGCCAAAGRLSHRVLVDTNYAPNTPWVTHAIQRKHLPSFLRPSPTWKTFKTVLITMGEDYVI